MAQPRKYTDDNARFRAYRARKKERIEALSREVTALSAKAKRSATVPRPRLTRLLREIAKRRETAKRQPQLAELLDYIQAELDRLLK